MLNIIIFFPCGNYLNVVFMCNIVVILSAVIDPKSTGICIYIAWTASTFYENETVMHTQLTKNS